MRTATGQAPTRRVGLGSQSEGGQVVVFVAACRGLVARSVIGASAAVGAARWLLAGAATGELASVLAWERIEVRVLLGVDVDVPDQLRPSPCRGSARGRRAESRKALMVLRGVRK